MSKKSDEKYTKLLTKLGGEKTEEDFNKTIDKIKDELLHSPQIPKDFNNLFSILTKNNIKHYIDMLAFIYDNDFVDERTKRSFRQKYVTAVVSLQGEEKYKAQCILSNFLQIEVIELYKDNTLINAALFDCMPFHLNDIFFAAVYSLLTQTQPKSILLLDFIAEAMITVALSFTGKLSEFYSLFKILDYYMNETQSWLPLKKIILAVLCLEYSTAKNSNTEMIWITIQNAFIHDTVGTFKILFAILTHFNSPRYLETFLAFTRYSHYMKIEVNHKPQDNQVYQAYLKGFKSKVPKDYFDKNKIAIQEGALLLIEKIFCEGDTLHQILIDFPFVIIIESLCLYTVSEDTVLSKAYLHFLLSLVNSNGDQVSEMIPEIVGSIDSIINVTMIDVNSDKEINRLLKKFYDKLLELIVTQKLSLTLLVNNPRVGTTLKKNKVITESFLFLLTMYSLEQGFDANCKRFYEQYVLKFDYPRFQSYYVDLLSYNLHSNRKRAEVIEKVIFKNQMNSFKKFAKDKCLRGKFINLLSDVMVKTPNEKSFATAFDLLLESNDYVIDCQKHTLVKLLDKLNRQCDHSKLAQCDMIMLTKEKFCASYSQSVILYALNKMMVNRIGEVFFSPTRNTTEEGYTPSQIRLLDPIDNSNNESTDYFILNYLKIVDYLMESLKTPEASNDKRNERIYETLALFAQKCFLLRKANISSLIVLLTRHLEETFKANNIRAFLFILDIFVYVCFHLKHDITKAACDDDILLNSDEKIKEIVIDALTKMFIELIESIKTDGNKSNIIAKATSFKEMPSFLRTSTTSNNSKDHSQLSNSQSNTRHSKESPSKEKTSSTHDEKVLDSDSKFKLKGIIQILQVLHLYLNSITEYEQHKPEAFLNTSLRLEHNGKLAHKEYGSQFLQSTIKKILDATINSLWIISFKPKCIIALLHFLLGIRELLYYYGDKTILRIIIIAIALGWSQEENNLFNQIELVFNTKPRKRIRTEFMSYFNPKSDSKKLQYEYIKAISDSLALYFIERFKSCALLLKVIQENLTKCSQPFRRNLFFELIKWHLLSRKSRDNILNETSNSLIEDSQLFIGDDSIIMLVPVSINTTDLVIRNLISNSNISISSKTEIIHQSQSVNLLKQLINNDFSASVDNSSTQENSLRDNKDDIDSIKQTKEKDGGDKTYTEINQKTIAKNNAIITFQQLIHYTCESFDKFSYVEKPGAEMKDKIAQLDRIPVYTTFFCGVIFAKGNCLTNEYDLLTYQGESSEEYGNFLNCLGIFYSIKDNPQLAFSSINRTASNYVISHQDSFFHLVFQVSHLIERSESNSDKVYASRKSIFDENFINIIWMDNPTKAFNDSLITRKTNDPFLYIVVFPIAQSHYIIKTLWPYENAIKKKCFEKIQSLFLADFILNVNNKSSVMYFIQYVIEINMMKEYLLIDIKLRENKGLNILNDVLKMGLSSNYAQRSSMIRDIINDVSSK